MTPEHEHSANGMSPKVSYIVSAFNRPRQLRGCLASLQVQTDESMQVLVADNATDPDMARRNQGIVRDFYDDRFRYICTDQHLANPAWDCYWSSEWMVQHHAEGGWLCFPSDDSIYLPPFQETCLKAAEANNWSLVFPEMLYDRRLHGKYSILNTRAEVCGIDKTGFLLRRDAWPGEWIGKPLVQGASNADGELIAELRRRGIRYGKVDEILVVHN